MKISIIIPHYNSVELLCDLLNSIPLEKGIEVIVVDDKSDDVFLEKYKKIQSVNSHVKFLENNTDKKGAGVCRNIGLKYATGKWIVFADADDYFTEEFVDEITKWYNSDNDVIYFKCDSIELETRKRSYRHIEFNQLIDKYLAENTESDLDLRVNFVVPWSKMIKKEFIDKNKITFSETLVANDVCFSTKVGILADKIAASTTVVYCVTRSTGSLTTQMTVEKLKIRYNVFVENYIFLRENLEVVKFKKLAITSQFFLAQIVLNKLGIDFFIYVIKKSIENKIPLFKKKLVNPLFFLERAMVMITMYKKDKKFYITNKEEVK